MHRDISRRDFLHGAVGGVVAGAALGAGCSPATGPAPGPVGMAGAPPDPALHPPSRLGLRGSHEGSFEVAHQLGREKRTDWGPAAEPDAGEYDLVVVGAGVSGLAAAFFYREAHPGARVLLLDNHDDFGGHARRNEFAWNGRTILGYGGSQSLEEPSAYSDVATGLLERIGVETKRLADAYDQDFYRRNDLAGAFFFDRAHYGADRLVRTDLIDPSLFLPVAPAGVDVRSAIERMPLSEPARQELLRLVEGSEDRLVDHSILSEPELLGSISYRDFLTKHLGVEQPEVLALLQDVPSNYFGHGIDVVPALEALGFGLPGLGSTSLGRVEGLIRAGISFAFEPYVYHFPDGNASVARLLVRRLVPAVAEGTTMDDVVSAAFDYAKLDRPDAEVRLRLGSTVVRVEHEGDPRSAERVGVTYLRGGRTERVRGRRVVLACYNMIVPYLCPELPAAQKEALASLVKVPLVYTNVMLRSWQAFRELGLAIAFCPGSWHQMAMLDFPVSLGDYGFAATPDDPVVLHMNRVPTYPGLPPRDQSRTGRHELLGTPFETIEREIRTHLAGMLGPGGFDPARDIEAIAVNRWPHGYAFAPNPLFDPEYEPGAAPHEIGRQRFGRIAIANSDAGGRAYLDEAIDQAWRAVTDLTS
ncbi:MAG: NAD(P)-binding protein [Myxococcota bacterium]|nr:NAD(P)-binding protein [Myxococcota bacterium]